jgi:hypothetical protein
VYIFVSVVTVSRVTLKINFSLTLSTGSQVDTGEGEAFRILEIHAPAVLPSEKEVTILAL